MVWCEFILGKQRLLQVLSKKEIFAYSIQHRNFLSMFPKTKVKEEQTPLTTDTVYHVV